MLTEVPEGAIPVTSQYYTQSTKVVLAAFATLLSEYSFYFPNCGTFSIYPSNIGSYGEVFAVAGEYSFEVKAEKEHKQLETIAQILEEGTEEDLY